MLTVPIQAVGQPGRGLRQQVRGQLGGAGLGLLAQPQPQEELQLGTDLPRGCPWCLCEKEARWGPNPSILNLARTDTPAAPRCTLTHCQVIPKFPKPEDSTSASSLETLFMPFIPHPVPCTSCSKLVTSYTHSTTNPKTTL